jgi:hypothetical protein
LCSIATRRGSIDSLSSRSATESGSSSSYGSPFNVIRKGSPSRGRFSVLRRRSGSQGKPLTKLGLHRPTLRLVDVHRSVPERTYGRPAEPHPEVGTGRSRCDGRAHCPLAERRRRRVSYVHVRGIRAVRWTRRYRRREWPIESPVSLECVARERGMRNDRRWAGYRGGL